MKRQIIAFGGGGFSMEPENPLVDDYILAQSDKEKPNICSDIWKTVSINYKTKNWLSCRLVSKNYAINNCLTDSYTKL